MAVDDILKGLDLSGLPPEVLQQLAGGGADVAQVTAQEPRGDEYYQSFAGNNITEPSRNVTDAAAPDGATNYDQIVQQYLQGMQQPQMLPTQQPLSSMQAMSVMMEPQNRDLVMHMAGLPAQQQKEQMQFDMERQGQAAQMASGLADRSQARQDKLTQQNWMHEMAAANAGTVGYNYTIPGLADVASMHKRSTEALINRRNQLSKGKFGGYGGQGGGAGGPYAETFEDPNAYMKWATQEIDDKAKLMATLQNSIMMLPAEAQPQMQRMIQNLQHDYNRLRNHQSALGTITDPADQMSFINELNPDERDQYIREIMAGLPQNNP